MNLKKILKDHINGFKNRFAVDHPDPNLRGAVINIRTRHRHGKFWITQRDVGTSFGLRFLTAYYKYKFGENNK